MKKLLLGIGTIAVALVPMVLSVSCSNKDDNINDIKGKKSVMPIISGENNHVEQNVGHDNALNDPFKIDEKIYPVAEDGIYMVKTHYKNGVFWNGNSLEGEQNTSPVINIKKIGNVWTDDVIELGTNDSFYVLFDDDDTDGFKSSEFLNELYYNDTSSKNSDSSKEENIKLNNKYSGQGSFPGLAIPFIKTGINKGELNDWTGSQSNHMKEESKKEGAKVVNGFLAVHSTDPLFTYEKVASNAYKVTLASVISINITASKFWLSSYKSIWPIKTEDSNNFIMSGIFSVGNKEEWSSYEGHPGKYTFLARKKEMVK